MCIRDRYERTGDIQQDMIDIDGDPDRFARGGEIIERRIKVPDYGYRLPEEIAFFTTETVYNDENEHLSFKQGGGHGGSHPHMIHEFIMSIVEEMCIRDSSYMTGSPLLFL